MPPSPAGVAVHFQHASLDGTGAALFASSPALMVTLVQSVAADLAPQSTVLCMGPARKLRIQELTAAQAVDFQPIGDHGAENADAVLTGALRMAVDQGRTFYLDPRVLELGPQFPTLAPLVESLRRTAILTTAAGGQLVRLTERN